MDDGIIFLPSHICKNTFLSILNSMDCAIKFTLEESQDITLKGIKTEKLNFLDMIVMLDENGTINTVRLEAYFKRSNFSRERHVYLLSA